MNSAKPGQAGRELYHFAGFCLNPLERRLTFHETVVAIPPKAFDALVALVQNEGRLMRKQDLHQLLWPDAFVEEVTLARAISDLRRILARHSTAPFIETVAKHGYRFVAEVHFSSEVDKPPLARRGTEEEDAVELARRAWYTIRLWSPDVVKDALAYARRAVAADPSYASAHAVLAYIYLYAGFGFVPGTDVFPRAKAAAAKALSLDARCAPAHAVMGMLRLVMDRDLAGAEECCRTAVELAPDQMPGHFAYSHLLAIQGRFPEALHEAQMALDADPLSCPVAYQVAGVLFYSGRDEEAVVQLRKFEYLDPDFLPARQLLAILYARLDRPEDALREAVRAVQLSGHNLRGRATLAIVAALLGRRGEAREILRELENDRSVPGLRWSYARAIIHCHLGEREAALDCLSQASEDRDGAVLLYLRRDPHFVALRNDERFTRLLDKLEF